MSDETNESNKLNSTAHQKPSTLNPVISLSAIQIINAFMTNKNKPSVNKVIGNVRRIRIGFIIAFSTARTIATLIAVQNVSMDIPSRIYDNPNATIEVTMMRMMNFIKTFYEIQVTINELSDHYQFIKVSWLQVFVCKLLQFFGGDGLDGIDTLVKVFG